MVKGPTAEVWTTLSDGIRRLIEDEDFRWYGVSFFIYMIGKEESTASPRIIFCSSDKTARKKICKAVRKSGLLEPYPQIRLGDSSSPLARGDSGLNRIGPPSSQGRPGAEPRNSREPRESGAARPNSRGTTSSSTGTHQALVIRPRDGQTSHIRCLPQDRELHIDFNAKVSINDPHSPESCSNSIFGAVSRRSQLYSEASAPSSKSSFSVEDPEQARSDTTTVKGGACGSSDCGDGDASDSSSDEYESYSEPGSTPEPTPLHDGYPIVLQERTEIVRKLLDAFDKHSYQQLPQSGSAQERPQIGYGGQQSSTDSSASSGAGKRSRDDLEREALEAGHGSIPDVGSKKVKGSDQKMLACPYWKKDRRTFFQCAKLQLKEVKNVKQHLNRKHTRKIRCPKCQDEFETEADCNHHVRFVSCQVQDEVEDSGISRDQVEELSKKGPARQTQWDRWYVVWRVVFPQLAPPSSPYLEVDLSEDMYDFREFFQRHGSAVILDHMRTSRYWTPDDERRFRDVHWTGILDTALEAIHRRWASQRPPLQDDPSRDPAPIPGGPVMRHTDAYTTTSSPSPLIGALQVQNDPVGIQIEPGYEHIPGFDISYLDYPPVIADPQASLGLPDDWNHLEGLPSYGFDVVPRPNGGG